METLETSDNVIAAQCYQNNAVVGEQLDALTQIFEPEYNLAVWQREASASITDYLAKAELETGVMGVVSTENVTALLNDSLPHIDGVEAGREALIHDVALQVDMLTCLVGCDEVGLRFTPLQEAMCPKFHVDQIQIRQICTYTGPATQWLPNHVARREFLGKGAENETATERLFMSDSDIQQLAPFDIGLLKGDAWRDNEGKGIIHRSPAVEAGHTRIVMTLDPM